MNIIIASIFLICLSYTICEVLDENVDAETKKVLNKNHVYHLLAKHKIHSITTNVCNMSLITSIENENFEYKSCRCDAINGYVDCSHLSITDLPLLISFSKNIQTAYFQENKISNIASETFFNGGDITELNLAKNHIDFISKTAFKHFQKLERMDLSHNQIWNIPKDVFLGLINLKRLDLSFNNLIRLTSEHFTDLVELKELVLKSNPLQELNIKMFEPLKKLEFMDLESTSLTELPAHVFVFTPNLRSLKLGGNRLTEVPSYSLYPLQHLKFLDLSQNPIKIIQQQAFLGLTGLVTLSLNKMPRLRIVEDFAFGDMHNLQELNCNNNLMLQEIAPNAFLKKSSNQKVPLVRLYLKHNALKNIPENILDWNLETELHADDNPFFCDCHLAWIFNATLKNNFKRHLKCFSPPKFANRALSDLKDYELTCTEKEDFIGVVLMSCLAILVLLTLIFTVSFFVWSRSCKRQRMPKFYRLDKNVVNDINMDYYGEDDFI